MLPMHLNESLGCSEAQWYDTSTAIMVQLPDIFQPLWNKLSISQKKVQSDTQGVGTKSSSFSTWGVCLGFYLGIGVRYEDESYSTYSLYFSMCTFIKFTVARIVDKQWINITACKTVVKYVFIYKNLSEIKVAASSHMRLPVGNPVVKGRKKQLAILHLKRNAASKWAKQV